MAHANHEQPATLDQHQCRGRRGCRWNGGRSGRGWQLSVESQDQEKRQAAHDPITCAWHGSEQVQPLVLRAEAAHRFAGAGRALF